jgi:diphthamide biosynthesis protein 7
MVVELKRWCFKRGNMFLFHHLCLSLDRCHTGSKNQIALSHSDALSSIVDVGQAKTVVLLSAEVHEFETWTTSYDCWDPELLYSGADDSHFCAWDLLQGFNSPIFGNCKGHHMRVCSIQSKPQIENMLIMGSYDENV